MIDYFACLTTPRCGSGMLTKTLRLHSEIFPFGEMFNGLIAARGNSMRLIHPPITKNENHMEFLKKISNSFPDDCGLKYFTFKLHYTHAVTMPAWTSFHQDLIDNNIPLVILKRKNTLKQTLSLYLAILNFSWSAKEYQQKLHADPDMIINQTYRYKKWNQYYHEIFENYENKISLTYEDIVQNPQKEFDKIFDMLKLDKCEINLVTQKQAKTHLLDYVHNPEELLSVISQKAPELLEEIDAHDFKPEPFINASKLPFKLL